MGKGNVDFDAVIRAPLARVFDVLTDHEGMTRWPGIKSSRLVKEGSPKNGLGAVRRIEVGGLTLDEEVVHYDAPSGFDYAIVRGVPIDHHLGQVRLKEVDGGVRVTWTIRIASRWPLIAQVMALSLRRGLPGVFRYLRGELEGVGP